MNNFSRLDGFYGSMLAAESIKDGMTVLHGPEGCRAYASNVSTRYVKRPLETREGDFFFHRSRIPCSCIDGDDYIYGSSEKVSMILDILRRNSTVFATVLESPGASLIGDRLADEVAAAGMDGHVAVLGKCFMSETFGYGYDRTLELIARKLVKKKEKVPGTVNLTGLTYVSKGCFPLLKEIRLLLGKMGLKVTADIGPGCTVQELKDSASAACNACLIPEYFAETGKFYEEELGVPLARGPLGAPVGYDALRAWLESVGEAADADPSPALEIVDEEESDVDLIVDSAFTMGEISRYKSYTIAAESSVAYPLAHWLSKKMKLAPCAIATAEHDPESEKGIRDMLAKMGAEGAYGRDVRAEYTDVFIGPGLMGALMEEKGECRTAIDAFPPSRDYLDIMPRPLLGLNGCRMIADRVYNTR